MLKRHHIFAVGFEMCLMLFKHNFTRLQGLTSSAEMKVAENLDQVSGSLKRTRAFKISWSLFWMTQTLPYFSLVDSFPVRTRVCVCVSWSLLTVSGGGCEFAAPSMKKPDMRKLSFSSLVLLAFYLFPCAG